MATATRQPIKINIDADLPTSREPLCHLTDAERVRLGKTCTMLTLPRGSKVYGQGDKADKIYFVLKGKVKTTQEGVSGRDQIVKLAAATDVIGYRAALAGERHSATATTIEDSTLISVPRVDAMDVIRENPALAAYIIKSLARELRLCRTRSVSLAQKQIRGRLAESLLCIRDKYGYVSGTRKLNIRMTREDLASLSNMTTANAIRTLRAFADEGLVEVKGREITVKDEPGLERTSRLG